MIDKIKIVEEKRKELKQKFPTLPDDILTKLANQGLSYLSCQKNDGKLVPPVSCWTCPFGHFLECHFPLLCKEAICSHILHDSQVRFQKDKFGHKVRVIIDPDGYESHYRRIDITKQTRFTCNTCLFFCSETHYHYKYDPPEPPYYDAECRLDGMLSQIWIRMEEESHNLNKDIGQGYPCFLWRRKWIQICPVHHEELDPEMGCVTCYQTPENKEVIK